MQGELTPLEFETQTLLGADKDTRPGDIRRKEKIMTPLRTRNSRRAVTLTELLVVLAIVSLLATLAVPVYVSQTERSRRAVAQFEVRQIADAQQAVAANYGFYVPIHILNNVPNDPNDTSVRDDFDNDPDLTNKYVIDIAIPVTSQLAANQLLLEDTPTDPRVRNMIDNWAGPFLNPQRVTRDVDQSGTVTQQELSRDIVLDPWGRPYRFYSPVGPTGSVEFEDDLLDWDTDNDGTGTDAYWQVDTLLLTEYTDGGDPLTPPYRDRFDRFAVVSFGGDGISDSSDQARAIDDIYYTFGTSLPQAP